MNRKIYCPHCNASFLFREEYIGRKVKCQRCQLTFEATRPVDAPTPVKPAARPAQPNVPIAEPADAIPSVAPATGPVVPQAQPSVTPVGQPAVPIAQPAAPFVQPVSVVGQNVTPVGQAVTPAANPFAQVEQPTGAPGGVGPIVSDRPSGGMGSYDSPRRRKKSNAGWLWGGGGGALILIAVFVRLALILVGEVNDNTNTAVGKKFIRLTQEMINTKVLIVNGLAKVRDLNSAKSKHAAIDAHAKKLKKMTDELEEFFRVNGKKSVSSADDKSVMAIKKQGEKVTARLGTEAQRIHQLSDYSAIARECPMIREIVEDW